MEHEGRCVGNRVNAYTSDMDFHGGSKADAKAAEEAKKTEAEDVLKKLLASGMSVDEILEKLK